MSGSGRNLPCPCGSRKKAKRCCLAADGWLKQPARCEPPPPPTRRGETKCFARPYADCKGGISREHFVSEDILKGFSGITVSGFAWQGKGVETKVGLNALVAKVLCRRHNSALDRLDQEAARFFRVLREFDRGLRRSEPSKRDSFVLFCGEDLERWVLKLLCGLLASGNASVGGQRVRVECIDQSWLDVLFGGAQWPSDAGLYLALPHDRRFWSYDSIGARLLTDPSGEVMGLLVEVAGIWLALCTVKPDLAASSAFSDGIRRPRELVFRSEATRKTAWLSWVDRSHQERVELTRVGEYDGSPP